MSKEPVTIRVYLDDGNIFEYPVTDERAARDHLHKIVSGGYRHREGDALVWYPPHCINKVKAYPFSGGYYPDKTVS